MPDLRNQKTPSPVIYRREGVRRLEPDELRLLAAAGRETWRDGLVFVGVLLSVVGLLGLATYPTTPLPGWLRGLWLAAVIGVFLSGFQVAQGWRQRSLLRDDLKQAEVVRFVAPMDEEGNPRSLELLVAARRVWRQNEGQPLPPETPWPLPEALNPAQLFEIVERPLSPAEIDQIPVRANREKNGWRLTLLAAVIVAISFAWAIASSDPTLHIVARSSMFGLPTLLRMAGIPERLALARLRAVHLLAVDAAAGTMWAFRHRDPRAPDTHREPVTTVELLPRSGLRWRGPFQDGRAAVVRQPAQAT